MDFRRLHGPTLASILDHVSPILTLSFIVLAQVNPQKTRFNDTMVSTTDLHILEQAIIAPPVTLGSLVKDLGCSLDDLTPRVTALASAGALQMCTTSDGAQLALAAGAPSAIDETLRASPVVAAWLQMLAAREGHGTRAVRTPSEFVSIATGFAHQASGLTLLLPLVSGPGCPQLLSHYLEAAKHAVRHHLETNLLIPEALLKTSAGQKFHDAMEGLGVHIRVARRVDDPLIMWTGVGLAMVLPDEVLVGAVDAQAYATATFQAGRVLQEVSPDTVVRMLSEGNTDAVSARKLGMSERQFRRHVSSLMTELGSTSRFQAGVEAARFMR
ncbi:MAG: hypothetical protein E7L00_11030 [Propionibacteriaceae bacterium]|nr:hypothetical protein [Propionibacteriaceae bacterium]